MKQYSIPVLMYHRIVKKRSDAGKHKIFVYEKNFIKQLDYLHKNGYQTITFNDIIQQKITDFNKKIILTFDDGYQDNYYLAFPLLKKYNFKAVIYLVTQETENVWGIKEGEPQLPLLTNKMIKEMLNYGIEFGAHTQHHLAVNEIPVEQAKTEIYNSKKDVEAIIQQECVSFAYPFGGINPEVKKMVKQAGYQFAVSTNTGPDFFTGDLFQIKRIDIGPRTNILSFKNKTSGYYFKRKNIFTLFSSH